MPQASTTSGTHSITIGNTLGRAALLVLSLVAGPVSAVSGSGGDTDYDGVPDDADAYDCDWTRAGVGFFPSTQFGTLLYEDNWPLQGDLDFNDAVIAYNLAFSYEPSGNLVTGARLTIQPRAIGAKYRSGLALRLPISRDFVAGIRRTIDGEGDTSIGMRGDDDDLVVTIADDLRALFGAGDGYVNTTGEPTGDGPVIQIDIVLSTPVDVALGDDVVDLFFFRSDDPGHEVHRPRFGGTTMMRTELFNTEDDASNGEVNFVDGSGLPFVIALPEASQWPRELINVEQVWPRIVPFAASGGVEAADFYLDPAPASLAFDAGPLSTVIDFGFDQCLPVSCDDGIRNGLEDDVDCGGDCAPCALGGTGAACNADDDCASGICAANVCATLPNDTDADGLTDLEETNLGTDGGDDDSDNDGMSDGVEVVMGLEPRQFSPRPPVTGTPISACGQLTAGTYYLTQDLVATGSGCLEANLQFAAVRIDCNGHSIIGNGTGVGIDYDVHNYGGVVSNCDISGFEQGIRAYVHNYDLTVERSHVHNNSGDGMYTGHHNYRTVVRNSRFSMNGGNGVNLTDWAQDAAVRSTVVRYNRMNGVTNDYWGQLTTCGNDVRDNLGTCNYQTRALGCVSTPVLEAACPPPPGTTRTVSLPLMLNGNYSATGQASQLGAIYRPGDFYGTEYRSWFAFDVSGEVGTVVSASLTGGQACSSGSGRVFSLYDISTPVFLLAQGAGVNGFNDMGTGSLLGSFDFTGQLPGPFSVPLNATGIAALQSRVSSGEFRIGGRYGMGAGLISSCNGVDQPQLVITFSD